MQRTLVADLIQGTPRVMKLFVKCLTALPNLHTLEIISVWDPKLVKAVVAAMRKEKPKLQRVRTLVLSPETHELSRYCPNVEDLTCRMAPDERFTESLGASGMNHLTRISALYNAQGRRNIWLSAACFASPPSMR